MTTDREERNLAHIAVCVCTYKRPALLARLLELLADQDTGDRFTYSIVVVDNDCEQSAKSAVDVAAARATVPIEYWVEPRQSIPLARNKAVAKAAGDFIAWLDDDQVPTKQWLLALFRALAEAAVDGVLGPVRPHFDEEPPQWLRKAGFYEHPTTRSGPLHDWTKCRIANGLLKYQLFADESQPFGPEFLCGEDQDFFRRMIAKGHTFIWCDDAVVYEVIPATRWKRGFLIRRALFRGLFSFRNRRSTVLPIVESLVAALAYAVAMPVALFFGQSAFMSCAFKCTYHTGRLMAVTGVNPIKEPYV